MSSCDMYCRIAHPIADHVHPCCISSDSNRNTCLDFTGDAPPPLVHNEDPVHPAHNELATTSSSAETVSAWDLRHHTDPGHAPACNHAVTLIQTRSRIRQELMPYQRSESARDNRPPLGNMIRTRSQIPHRSLANPVCRLRSPTLAEGRTAILRMWLICRICI